MLKTGGDKQNVFSHNTISRCSSAAPKFVSRTESLIQRQRWNSIDLGEINIEIRLKSGEETLNQPTMYPTNIIGKGKIII